MTPVELELELVREAARSSRRRSGREFALISVFSTSKQPIVEHDDLPSLILEYQKRLRISDSIAASEDQLFVLLPETDRDGANQVANDLIRIALQLDFRIDTEMRLFPDDDTIAAEANEIRLDFAEPPATCEISRHGSEHDPGESTKNIASMSALCRRPDLAIPFAKPIPTPFWKRMVDVTGSLAGLLFLSPIFVAAAIAIKLDSRGPIFFKQIREGKDGKHFGIWKFRTMCNDAEQKKKELLSHSEQDGPAFKLADDPRVTPVGRYLRKSCVDELPQLFNVLRGEMSLVGPRPLPVTESEECKVWQRSRLRALPGLTCIWQVDGGRDIEFDEWMRMDLEYLRRRGFWFDIKMILRTAGVAIMHRGSV